MKRDIAWLVFGWVVIMASVYASIAMGGCGPGPKGTVIASTDAWYAAIRDTADDWRSEPSLPSIDNARCELWLATVEIRVVPMLEWPDTFGMCPYGPDGCYRGAPCDRPEMTTCVTGTIHWYGDSPVIYLTPDENADGHVITVRHEAAHMLSACSSPGGRDLDQGHTRALVWRGSDSVVWRR